MPLLCKLVYNIYEAYLQNVGGVGELDKSCLLPLLVMISVVWDLLERKRFFLHIVEGMHLQGMEILF